MASADTAHPARAAPVSGRSLEDALVVAAGGTVSADVLRAELAEPDTADVGPDAPPR